MGAGQRQLQKARAWPQAGTGATGHATPCPGSSPSPAALLQPGCAARASPHERDAHLLQRKLIADAVAGAQAEGQVRALARRRRRVGREEPLGPAAGGRREGAGQGAGRERIRERGGAAGRAARPLLARRPPAQGGARRAPRRGRACTAAARRAASSAPRLNASGSSQCCSLWCRVQMGMCTLRGGRREAPDTARHASSEPLHSTLGQRARAPAMPPTRRARRGRHPPTHQVPCGMWMGAPPGPASVAPPAAVHSRVVTCAGGYRRSASRTTASTNGKAAACSGPGSCMGRCTRRAGQSVGRMQAARLAAAAQRTAGRVLQRRATICPRC